MDILFTDCLIYSQDNSGHLLFLGNNYPEATESYHGDVIFRNCDIFKQGRGWGFYIDYRRGEGNTDVVFDGCRLYDTGAVNVGNLLKYDVYSINGTLAYNTTSSSSESDAVLAGDGFENVTIPTFSRNYYVPAISVPVDTQSLINAPTFVIEHSIKHSIYFNCVTTKPVEVNWMNGDAVYKTETLYPGVDSFEGPELIKELPDDLYRNLKYQWVDAKGVLSTDAEIDWTLDTLNFKTAESVNGVTNYVASLKDIRFNLTYYGHLAYYLYAPAVEGVTLKTFGDYAVNHEKTTLIDGNEYWSSNAGWIIPKAGVDDKEKTIIYTVDGVQYSAKVNISALVYAEILCQLYEQEMVAKG